MRSGWAARRTVATTGVALALVVGSWTGLSPASAADGTRGAGAASRSATRPAAMDLPRLQLEAARLQAEFVRASLELERAGLALQEARATVRIATGRAERAQAEADAQGDQLEAYLDLLYREGPAMDPSVVLLLTGLDETDAQWQENLVFREVSANQTVVVARAQDAQQQADILHAQARATRLEADAAEEEVQEILADISEKADEVTAAAQDSFEDNQQAALFNDATQKARNDAARAAWQDYRRRLDRAGLRPPPASVLQDPTRLPRGMKPLRQGRGKPLPGVAAATGATALTVVPRPVVRAVDRAFAALGKPFAAGNDGPQTYDCGGLVRAAYGDLGRSPVEQYEHTVRVDRSTVQVGDLVFFADPGAGVHHVGMYVGGNLMVAADGPTSQVGVLSLPGQPFAVTRPSLGEPRRAERHAAPEGDGSRRMACGSELLPGGATSAGMLYPVAKGAFDFSAQFGQPGPRWESGFHTGLDFAAPVGTPVVAARDGVVTVSRPKWAGTLVTIDHGSGVQSRYAHLSSTFVQTGDRVLGGQSLGAVGRAGNATGPHLHFEVLVVGTTVDPMLFLSGGSNHGPSGWGGFLNGMIPTSELCPLSVSASHLLRCDAARAFDAMAASYRAAFGGSLCLTDSYRSFASQVSAFARKPKLAAVPGTSNHGWALAVDLCGGVEGFGTPQHAWLQENGPLFGWFNPDWAAAGGDRPEPWHWEFGRSG